METHLIKVLDQGFVSLVDFMGGDLAVVQGARVSFGQETKGDERDRKLINYLMRHEHGTPFELSVFKFHVKAPIFVARQWFRHRVGCLSGETLLHFDLPSGKRRGKSKLHKTSIAKIHQLFHAGSTHETRKRKPLFLERVEAEKFYTIAELAKLVERRAEDLRNLVRKGALHARRDETAAGNKARIFVRGADWHSYARHNYEARVGMRGRVAAMNLRMCNECTGAIEHTGIADIWQSGVKPVYRVTLDNGYQIKMTDEHRCLTQQGWMTLAGATGLKRTARGAVTWNTDAPAFAVNGTLQRVENVASLPPSLYATKNFKIKHTARVATRLMRAYSPIAKIEYAGEEMTYDLEVTGEFHNFVANGFVVHNSYNEISYRYVEVKDEFYVPSELRAQDAKNKQASFAGSFNEDETRAGQELIGEAYREAYARYLKLLEMGVAREMARIVLPVGMYTQFYVAYNARSLMNFVRLRMGEGAQTEIRLYADAMNRIFKQLMPWTHEAFEKFVLKRGENA